LPSRFSSSHGRILIASANFDIGYETALELARQCAMAASQEGFLNQKVRNIE
jgi:hypothetical protein